jgi:hypothetical protein
LSGGSWFSAKENWRLSDSEILKAIAGVHPNFVLGCRAGKTTRYAVLDIDSKSKYHSKPQLDRLLLVLSNAGLSKSSLYRSSYSGGWHLYLFFDEPIGSLELRRELVKLLSLNDFEIAKGTLEIFPHRANASLGLGLRLPLQPGFAWLDKRDLEVQYERAQLSPTKALEFFLDALDSDANSYSSFRQLKAFNEKLEAKKTKSAQHGIAAPANIVPIRRELNDLQPSEFGVFVGSIFRKLPPGIIVDNWYKGRLFHLYGLSGPSQRAEAIVCVGHYFFYGDPSRDLPALGYGYEQEREWALQKFLSARHNGQSQEINAGRPDAIAQVQRAAHWRPQHTKANEPVKYSPVRPISWVRENQNRKLDARQRIQQAFDNLRSQQRAFTTVELQQQAKCSRRTLYDHEDIWRAVYDDRKSYRDLATGFFANCTDEYNDVVGADCSKIKPPTTTPSEITPPGLLAARRISYELSMRGKRNMQKAEKQAEISRDASAEKWNSEVKELSSAPPASLTIQKLKALIVLLSHYLSLAPFKEDEDQLRTLINRLRDELASRIAQSSSPSGYG